MDNFFINVGLFGALAGSFALGVTVYRWLSARIRPPRALAEVFAGFGVLSVSMYLVQDENLFLLGFLAFSLLSAVYGARTERDDEDRSDGIKPGSVT